jgi:methyl-accepting chemotaxis protein
MKFPTFRVSHKLWSLVIGELVLLVVLTIGTQVWIRKVTEEAEKTVLGYEQSVNLATRWHGVARMTSAMATFSVSTTDEALANTLDKRVNELLVEISAFEKEAFAAVKTPKDREALEKIVSQNQPRAPIYYRNLEEYVNLQHQQRDSSLQTFKKIRDDIAVVTIGTIVLVTCFSIFFSIFLVRSITRPIAQVVVMAERIASGDLTEDIKLDRTDEFGQLMHAISNMSKKLKYLVLDVRYASESVSSASREISDRNLNLSSRTSMQASALEETSATMEELSLRVTHNADNAQLAKELAAKSSTVAIHGREIVSLVIDTMNDISDSSKRISEIVGVINSIAFQTNILALNAAVEAARAGEQGRGFAVVASEVRSLAGRSAVAAKEIESLIGSSVQIVARGTSLVDEAGGEMSDVVNSITVVDELVGKICDASNKQSLSVTEIREAVSQMDQSTQRNAALVEEMAASATSLKSQADELVVSISVFKTDIEANLSETTKMVLSH